MLRNIFGGVLIGTSLSLPYHIDTVLDFAADKLDQPLISTILDTDSIALDRHKKLALQLLICLSGVGLVSSAVSHNARKNALENLEESETAQNSDRLSSLSESFGQIETHLKQVSDAAWAQETRTLMIEQLLRDGIGIDATNLKEALELLSAAEGKAAGIVGTFGAIESRAQNLLLSNTEKLEEARAHYEDALGEFNSNITISEHHAYVTEASEALVTLNALIQESLQSKKTGEKVSYIKLGEAAKNFVAVAGAAQKIIHHEMEDYDFDMVTTATNIGLTAMAYVAEIDNQLAPAPKVATQQYEQIAPTSPA